MHNYFTNSSPGTQAIGRTDFFNAILLFSIVFLLQVRVFECVQSAFARVLYRFPKFLYGVFQRSLYVLNAPVRKNAFLSQTGHHVFVSRDDQREGKAQRLVNSQLFPAVSVFTSS